MKDIHSDSMTIPAADSYCNARLDYLFKSATLTASQSKIEYVYESRRVSSETEPTYDEINHY